MKCKQILIYYLTGGYRQDKTCANDADVRGRAVTGADGVENVMNRHGPATLTVLEGGPCSVMMVCPNRTDTSISATTVGGCGNHTIPSMIRRSGAGSADVPNVGGTGW